MFALSGHRALVLLDEKLLVGDLLHARCCPAAQVS